MDKDTAMKLLIAISQIEGYMIGVTGMQRPSMVYENLDTITEELVKIVKEGK